jgi:hypothetical protein
VLKSKIRVILLGVVAACALSALASASASAAKPQWFIGGAEFHGTETVTAKAETAFTLTSSLTGGAKVVISCTGINAPKSEIFKDNEDASEKIVFTTCTVTEPAKCVVPASITTSKIATLGQEAGTSEVFDKFSPSGTETFVTIPVTGCAGEGNYAVKGTARCAEAAPATETTSKNCAFTTTSGNSLKFGINTAALAGTVSFTLIGANKGKVWSGKF